ncbi:aldo/keto reductase [Algiphilus sp. NNCM1]|nr:aldo/keto reductase [Algiphilus acroporae]MCI5104188.1 aldo/keto reductase [Algiphilus sp.]
MGSTYGVANRTGRPDIGEVEAILAMASDAGLKMLDTAAAYGQSEEVLGRAGVSRWQIVTKVPPLVDVPRARVGVVIRESVVRSLDRLRCEKLYGVMVHAAGDLTGTNAECVADALSALRADGLCEKAGLSIYRPQDLVDPPSSFFPGIVQAPLNPLDQRIVTTGTAQRLTENGCEVHARSLFLQGILLMPPASRPARFARWAAALSACDAALGDDPLASCLGFAAAQPGIARLVVGVENETQLSEILVAASQAREPHGTAALANNDPNLIEPPLWGES